MNRLTDTQRNFLILAAIAVIGFTFSGRFGIVAGTSMGLINIAFVVLTIMFLVQLRRSKASQISSMPTGDRILFDGCLLAIGIVMVTGQLIPGWAVRNGGTGTVVFFGLIAALVYGAYVAWQRRPNRW
jgi:hypothetical protein